MTQQMEFVREVEHLIVVKYPDAAGFLAQRQMEEIRKAEARAVLAACETFKIPLEPSTQMQIMAVAR